jgi:ABC transport system ATP-binding/permease protein
VRARVESQVMFILVLSAIWLGCLNSAREIVKELPIYRRERSVNLAILSYLTSKLLPLAGFCAFQCIALLLAVGQFVSIPGGFLARAVALFATAWLRRRWDSLSARRLRLRTKRLVRFQSF